jgi:hypothetical protein
VALAVKTRAAKVKLHPSGRGLDDGAGCTHVLELRRIADDAVTS